MSNLTSRAGLVATADLRADCARCVGLCCVALGMSRSADFAIQKLPGRPCPNLTPAFRCGIHDRLRQKGFAGCDAFDCFGAGQQVTERTFAGHSWLEEPAIAAAMFSVFDTMRHLKEALWHLAHAAAATTDPELSEEIERARTLVVGLTDAEPARLERFDAMAFQEEIGKLLGKVSTEVRAGLPAAAVDHRGADLAGAELSEADLRGADLRGALLMGSDLSRAELFGADLLGSDLRGANLAGARLEGALFLTQAQVASAVGDPTTTIPPSLARPRHWQSRG